MTNDLEDSENSENSKNLDSSSGGQLVGWVGRVGRVGRVERRRARGARFALLGLAGLARGASATCISNPAIGVCETSKMLFNVSPPIACQVDKDACVRGPFNLVDAFCRIADENSCKLR